MAKVPNPIPRRHVAIRLKADDIIHRFCLALLRPTNYSDFRIISIPIAQILPTVAGI